MSDLFHPDVPDEYIVAVTKIMLAADWHIFQVLTKRAERQLELLNTKLQFAASANHIWWGVSVENRKHGVPRISNLRQAEVKVRFLSIEPLLEDLGTVDFSGIHWAIVGGESGPGARAMKAAWVESLLMQCKANEVPFFFKQWGGVQKKRTGRELMGRTFDEYPAIEPKPAPSKLRRLELQSALSKSPEIVRFLNGSKAQILERRPTAGQTSSTAGTAGC
jgi:protein gp37